MNDEKLSYIDLFSGCGGLSEGFNLSRRFNGIAHVEWEKPMVETLRHRLADKWGESTDAAFEKVIHFDMQRSNELLFGNWAENSLKEYPINSNVVKESGLSGLVGGKKVDVVIGGPPCQAYSIAGRAQDKHSMKYDYRNYLFESYVRVVEQFRPKVFVFENVPGMLSAKPGDVLVTNRIHTAFTEAGYRIRQPDKMPKSVYSMDEFGVPQKRRRVILIGVSVESGLNVEDVYKALDGKKSGIKKDVKMAIGGLPQVGIGKESTIENHKYRPSNDRDRVVFKKWVIENMNSKPTDEKIKFYNMLLKRDSKHAKYRSLEWDKPSPTIVAHLQKDGLMFIHPDAEQARTITVKEAALLQSFPDDFKFLGSMGVCYKMIGNAVPPAFAQQLAEVIGKSLTQ